MTERERLAEYCYRELVGPLNGENEIINERPTGRYTVGILFPRDLVVSKVSQNEQEDESVGSPDTDIVEDPVNFSNQMMPSAAGLSFLLKSRKLEVKVYGASYEWNESQNNWIRLPHASRRDPFIKNLDITMIEDYYEAKAFEGKLLLHVKRRKLRNGDLLTVTIMNNIESNEKFIRDEDCLFQVGLECKAVDGEICEYPAENKKMLDDEEQELELIYRKHKTFAVGHGCAANWDVNADTIEAVAISFLPSYEIKPLTYETGSDESVLELSLLANPLSYDGDLFKKLDKFADNYEIWANQQSEINNDIEHDLLSARDRILSRLQIATARIRQGIQTLRNDRVARKSFQLANLAMLIQMYRSSDEFGGKRRKNGEAKQINPDYLKLKDYKWRPFQLAFTLLSLESIINKDSLYRDSVDLIWFPTGGGKTEAYLLAASLLIFYRRLMYKDEGAGTNVITRYTLRLLTIQQFERTSRLVCALEKIRNENEAELGSIPITIGLWVGGSTTPNRFKEAKDKLAEIYDQEEPESPFILESCPWCGTEIIPERRIDDKLQYGVSANENNFNFNCVDPRCLFNNKLPINVVDEALYKEPPSILIATVDKFARMAWDSRNGVFLGTEKYLPPSLIIQDELHLLSGPLGTISGLYESAIKTVLNFKGHPPKVIASTATIRNASSQTVGLFGKNAKIFPSPGLEESDSYFMRKDYSKVGRMYYGVMSQSHSPSTSFIRTTASLLQGVTEIDQKKIEYDAYYTLVAYHNSLRELGKTITFARDDIPDRLSVISEDSGKKRSLEPEQVIELTSNLNDIEIPFNLARLKTSYYESDSASFVACTNMFSVGVDIQRLGLMIVHGQPKTTSEYIQATSRVGRGKVPGLVIAHYSATKPRDRSHYESFIPYHSKIYRYVEPTSVTPFSNPARNRALHAALIIMCRHGIGLKHDTDAHLIIHKNEEVKEIIKLYMQYVSVVDKKESINTEHHLNSLLEEWNSWANKNGNGLVYKTNAKDDRGVMRLLIDFNEKREGWKTLNSMRNVDEECRITVSGSY